MTVGIFPTVIFHINRHSCASTHPTLTTSYLAKFIVTLDEHDEELLLGRNGDSISIQTKPLTLNETGRMLVAPGGRVEL